MPEQTSQQESPYELARLIQNLVQVGTVAEVRAKPLAVRMQCGDNTTDWLKPVGWAAGAVFSAYRLPEVGEQGIVLGVGGDLGQGIALLGIHSNAMPQPSDGPPHIKLNQSNTHFLRYEDGALKLCIGPASITIAEEAIDIAVGGARLNISDDLITSNVDVMVQGISSAHHKHPGVIPGPALTLEPK